MANESLIAGLIFGVGIVFIVGLVRLVLTIATNKKLGRIEDLIIKGVNTIVDSTPKAPPEIQGLDVPPPPVETQPAPKPRPGGIRIVMGDSEASTAKKQAKRKKLMAELAKLDKG